MDPVLWGVLVASVALVVAIMFVLRRRQGGTTRADDVRRSQGRAESIGQQSWSQQSGSGAGGSGPS